MQTPKAPDSGTDAASSTAGSTSPDGVEKTRRDVSRNLGAFAVGHFMVRLAGLGSVVVIARALSTADFGRYSVALALSAIFMGLVESGMGGYLVREGTQSPERAAVALGHVIVLQLVTGTLAVGVCTLLALVLGYDQETLWATIFLAIGSVALIAQRSFLAILSALNKSRVYAGFQSGQALVSALATVGAALAGTGPAGIGAALMISALLTYPVANLLLRRHWNQRIRFERSSMLQTLGVAAAYSATKLGAAFLTYIDAVMVQAFKGNVAAAEYGASYRLTTALRLFQQVYSDGLAQPAARLARDNRTELQELLNRSMSQLFFVGLPIGVGGVLLAERILTAVFGDQYATATTTISILFLTLPMSFACQPCVIFALALGLEKRIAKAFGVTVLVNVATNLVLIPLYGPAGAAAAMVLSSLVLYGIATRLIWSEGIRFSLGARVLKVLVAGGIMAGTVLLAGPLPLVLVIVLGAAAYLGAIRALRTLDENDLAMMPMGSRLGWLVAR